MKTLIVLVVMGILGYIGYSANKPKKNKLPQTGVVYFYPRANVYYEVATGHYVFFDGSKWQKSKSFSEEQKLSLGERAIIQHPVSPVWKNNETDRMLYSARLYAPSRNFRQKFREDSVKSLPKPVAPPVIKKEKTVTQDKDSLKHKSGIGRFLERLFKGKKKE